MGLDVEGVVDGGVAGEEPLGGALGFELLLLSLSSSNGPGGTAFRPGRKLFRRSAPRIKAPFISCRTPAKNRMDYYEIVGL